MYLVMWQSHEPTWELASLYDDPTYADWKAALNLKKVGKEQQRKYEKDAMNALATIRKRQAEAAAVAAARAGGKRAKTS